MCYQSGSEEMGVEVPTRSASSSEGEMERGGDSLVWSPLSLEVWLPY
jgi:hypothetical protein